MSNSLLRTMIFLAAASLTLGAPGFAQTISQTQTVGGPGGDAFQDTSIPVNARIFEVRVSAGSFIDSVQLVYELPDGRTLASTRHGGSGGQTNSFRLDADEYIIGISGRHGQNIDSLRIHTNKRASQLYGGSGGRQDFRIEVPSGNQAVGFIGRSGRFVDALGLAYTPAYLRIAGQTRIAGESGGNSFSDNQIPIGARITEIRIQVGRYIDGIQAIYTLPDGSTFEGPFHGGRGGNTTVFRLDANEYITGISGRHGEYLDSLRIHTNRRASQVFGGSGGRESFRIDVPSGNQAVGLIGRSGRYLDALGLSYASVGRSSGRSTNNFFRRRTARERN